MLFDTSALGHAVNDPLSTSMLIERLATSPVRLVLPVDVLYELLDGAGAMQRAEAIVQLERVLGTRFQFAYSIRDVVEQELRTRIDELPFLQNEERDALVTKLSPFNDSYFAPNISEVRRSKSEARTLYGKARLAALRTKQAGLDYKTILASKESF